MSKSESQKARAKLYRSKSFRRELAGDFGIGPMKDLAVSCLDALLETRRLPSRGETNAGAAAIDAALIMIAIGTMQTNQKAMLSLTDRLSAMELSKVIDIGGSPKRELSVAAASNLISDLTNAFEEHWAAPDSAFLEGLGHIVFITNIGDAPAGDAATILRVSDNRQYSYSTVTPPAVEEEFRRTMRGGMSFMPAAFANLADHLRNDLDGTAATVRMSGLSVEGATDRQPGAVTNEVGAAMTDPKGTKTVSSSEFVQLLRKEIPGETEAAGTLLLSFEMLGRSVVGGIAYHRDGGPNDEIKRLATLVMAMGGMAVEAARRHPRGWVVVDAFGRPCCHPEEGRTEFHPSGEIIIFGNEEESARFAARVNAQPGDDPALPALSLSAQRFATEATRHAEMYRRFISDEQISLDA